MSAPLPRNLVFLLCAGLFLSTFLLFLPAAGYDFINFDDDEYVTANRNVNRGLSIENTAWAFTRFHSGNWHPITWISHQIDCQLYGENAGGHHLTNVIIHALNSVLLFLCLLSLSGAAWRSALVAALFAVHPLHVESVAWISERKDLLSAFFMFLAQLAYARFARRPRAGRYLLVLILFSAGLMSKPMLVTFPVILLLLDFWPLRRLTPGQGLRASLRTHAGLLTEKIPFLILSAASAVITFFAQRAGGAMNEATRYPLDIRVGNAILSFCTYLLKTVWPSGLAIPYPYPPVLSIVNTIAMGAALCVVSAIALLTARRTPWIFVGWFWFLVMLTPVIGLIQVGAQARADRYTYLPLIGIFVVAAWAVPSVWMQRRFSKAMVVLSAAVILFALGVASLNRLRYWENSRSLFARTLAVTCGSFTAHLNYGSALVADGLMDSAVFHFRAADSLNSSQAVAPYNIGLILARQDSIEQARMFFSEALRRDPRYVQALHCQGEIREKTGEDSAARAAYDRCMDLDPEYWPPWFRSARMLAAKGELAQAESRFHRALWLKADNWETHFGLAGVLARQGKIREALDSYASAIKLNPRAWEPYADLGQLLLLRGQGRPAIAALSMAISLDPTRRMPYMHRARAYQVLGMSDSALADSRKVDVMDSLAVSTHSGR